MPPQPRQNWTHIWDATLHGPGCTQPHHNADVPCNGHEGPRCESEDCLNLDVYCPAEKGPAGGYPVMFWLHGGAFNEGMSYGPVNLYDGSRLAAGQAVCVVSANYRLGVLGFLVNSEQAGNQGILDQRAALRFVRDNIAAFGGNPHAVTLWGQSAGAMSVAVHLVSPPSAGLFHRAIMESNVASFRYQRAANQRLAFGDHFARLTPCKDLKALACLRALPANETIHWGEKAAGSARNGVWARVLDGGHILDAFAMEWSPVIDGEELPDDPLQLAIQGKIGAKVPVLLGTVQDEGATFVYAGIKRKLPELLWPTTMRGIFGMEAGEKVIQFYRPARKTWHDLRDSLSYVITDYWFKCSTARLAAAFSAAGLDAFLYRYDHVLSFPQIFTEYGLPAICANRTCHASEVPFVFQNYANFTPTPPEIGLSGTMVAYWSAFARTGDPNTAQTEVVWPVFNTSARHNLRIGIPIGVESTKQGQTGPGVIPGLAGVCAMYDQVGYTH